MSRIDASRRSFLAVTASCSLAGIAGVGFAKQDGETSVSRDSFVLLEGTDRETTVHETTAAADGPTVLVVGGVHGNEIAGYRAAGAIADWTIDAGTLVTIPEANAVAIERGRRVDDEGVDLNRQFPTGAEPRTELARAIWGVVEEYEPDVVVDLHESIGIYDDDPVDGVGQAIFHSPGDAADAARDAAEYVNRNYVDDPDLAFRIGPFSGPDRDPQGLLVHKVARDTDADAFLPETLSTDVALETRVRWHTAIVERLVADELFSDAGSGDGTDESDADDEPGDGESDEVEEIEPDEGESDGDESDGGGSDEADDGPEPDPEPPIARIRTTPENAAELDLERGQTVTLDASASSAPTGEIVSYEWDVGSDGSIDETGERVEAEITVCGTFPITLRVTDDAGEIDAEEVVLSTT